MNSYQTTIPTNGLSTQERQHLQNIPPQASILCILKHQPNQDHSCQSCQRKVRLQIIGDYLVIREYSQERILGGLICDYQIKFEVIRNIPQDGNGVGRPIAILFKRQIGGSESLASQEIQISEQPLEFRLLQNVFDDFQTFIEVLSRKFIVQTDFHKLFRATRRIGKGATAIVYHATNLKNGQDVAIKSFKRSVYFSSVSGKAAFLKEFKVLTKINHPNICKMHGVYQTSNSTYVVLDMLALPLNKFIERYGFPKIDIAKKIAKDILEAIEYLHDKGIMHRDLKLQNIMIKKDNKYDVNAVIVDLGLAEYTNSTKYLYVRCGTPGYVAPEVLSIKPEDANRTYTQACDIFSLGVILHIILLKKPLFEGINANDVILKNSECNIDFTNSLYNNVDGDVKDLLMKMLCKQPEKRITAKNALNHSFFYNIDENSTQISI